MQHAPLIQDDDRFAKMIFDIGARGGTSGASRRKVESSAGGMRVGRNAFRCQLLRAETRRCPHCNSPSSVRNGQGRELLGRRLCTLRAALHQSPRSTCGCSPTRWSAAINQNSHYDVLVQTLVCVIDMPNIETADVEQLSVQISQACRRLAS